MNTYITIHISKRKKIQLTIDEAQRLYMQLADWLNPRQSEMKYDCDNIKELLQPTTVKAYTPPPCVVTHAYSTQAMFEAMKDQLVPPQ